MKAWPRSPGSAGHLASPRRSSPSHRLRIHARAQEPGVARLSLAPTSRPKQALDASQASPSQGPRTRPLLQPAWPMGPALDKPLTSFPDWRDGEGGAATRPGSFKGLAQPTPHSCPCVSDQAHSTSLEMVGVCVQRVWLYVCANMCMSEHVSSHHCACAHVSLCVHEGA